MFALADINSFYASCEKVFRPDLRNEPVIVLSNNDGCVIARSRRQKPWHQNGAAWFQVRQMRLEKKIHVFSQQLCAVPQHEPTGLWLFWSRFLPAVEPYSIDEMFMICGG